MLVYNYMSKKSLIKINQTSSVFEGSLEDRIKLESLIRQVLPSLIKNKDERTQDILEFIQDKKATLASFLAKYPEYKSEKIIINQSALKTLDYLKKKNEEEFIPVVDFMHEVLIYLEKQLKVKKIIIAPRDDFNYRFQLRLMLYRNFNKYLNILLLQQPEREALAGAEKLLTLKEKKQFLEALSFIIKSPTTVIINNFWKLINKPKELLKK